MKSIRLWAEVALVIAVLAFGYLWWQKFTEPAPVGIAVEAKPSALVKTVETEKRECVPVIVYRDKAKEKLKLPESVKQDSAKSVISATEVRPDYRPHTVTTVLDTGTGKTTTYDTRMALPWLAIDTRGEAGLAYGYKDGQKTIRLEVRQALADIKAVKVGVIGTYDVPLAGGDAAAFVGVGAWYRW